VLDYGLEDGRGNVLRRLRWRRKGCKRRGLWRGGHDVLHADQEEELNWEINRNFAGLTAPRNLEIALPKFRTCDNIAGNC
jgi:hypothetical protein